MQQFIHRVNALDKLAFVDTNWTRFAIENGLASLTAESVEGVPLWNYLSDLTTRHLYRIFMQKVRQTGQSISVPFRCDAPDRRRFMRMTIRPLAENGLEFSSELLREEPRPRMKLLDSAMPRGSGLIRMCSWCKKVQAPDWVEVEQGVERLKLFDMAELPGVTHSICPECENNLENYAA